MTNLKDIKPGTIIKESQNNVFFILSKERIHKTNVFDYMSIEVVNITNGERRRINLYSDINYNIINKEK